MAISVSSLAAGIDDSDATSYASASISPTSGLVWLLWAAATRDASDADPAIPSASGAGLTWTYQNSFIFPTGAGLRRRRIALFIGTGTPSTGTVTVNWTNTMANAGWDIWELTGADTTNPIVQVVTNGLVTGGATSGSVTLAAASNSANRPASAFAHGTNEFVTNAASWTEVRDMIAGAGPSLTLETQWRSDTFDTAAAASWATSSAWGGIAAEIRAASAAGAKPKTLLTLGVG